MIFNSMGGLPRQPRHPQHGSGGGSSSSGSVCTAASAVSSGTPVGCSGMRVEKTCVRRGGTCVEEKSGILGLFGVQSIFRNVVLSK